ncbi:MAG TPA: 2,3-diphosphoglycerate-dependent phosphoglycerate mutase [Euryarchaeota archaeon]|nr:2,3-diphosphoglycerate-dependent phosphoglycerate mutase [Euryarchaeota archaeon]
MSTLILLRHGTSVWNKENIFTGWTDVPLAPEGEEEAKEAGKKLKNAGILPDVWFTSYLERAIMTGVLALQVMKRLWIPCEKHWRLNERHYGALQGRNKDEVREEVGDELYWAWRRSYDVPPPPLSQEDPRHPRYDEKYRNVLPRLLPDTESLKDTVERVLVYWKGRIVPELKRGKKVLIAAHGNTLRGIVMMLENLTPEEVKKLEIPKGVPIVYELDKDLKTVEKSVID